MGSRPGRFFSILVDSATHDTYESKRCLLSTILSRLTCRLNKDTKYRVSVRSLFKSLSSRRPLCILSIASALRWSSFHSQMVSIGLSTMKYCPSLVSILTWLTLPEWKPLGVRPSLSINILYQCPSSFRTVEIKESLSTSDPASVMVKVREEINSPESRDIVIRKRFRNLTGIGSSTGRDFLQYPQWKYSRDHRSSHSKCTLWWQQDVFRIFLSPGTRGCTQKKHSWSIVIFVMWRLVRCNAQLMDV